MVVVVVVLVVSEYAVVGVLLVHGGIVALGRVLRLCQVLQCR